MQIKSKSTQNQNFYMLCVPRGVALPKSTQNQHIWMYIGYTKIRIFLFLPANPKSLKINQNQLKINPKSTT
jgi:hypothetical protein